MTLSLVGLIGIIFLWGTDEGKRPIFERKELLEWSTQGKSEEKPKETPSLKIQKDKKKARSESPPSSDERSRKKEKTSPRKRNTSPVSSHIKIRFVTFKICIRCILFYLFLPFLLYFAVLNEY